jgi:hypothetical protein
VIQATLQTDKGPIGIIGINRENWLRLQAGMPLDIDLKSLTPPGTRMNRIIIHYAPTYEDVVKDLEQGGFPITTLFRLDDQLLDLAMVQAWIDLARNRVPLNQKLQLEMDRRQSEVDRRRALIAKTMRDISSRN